MNENQDFLDFALKLSEESRAIIKRFLNEAVDFQTKEDQSPVTNVDQEIESTLRKLIEDKYPNHGFWGEESQAAELTAAYVWVIDPIDGTKAFITGLPVFGTLISLVRDGEPILGVMDFPATSERFWGIEGKSSLYCGKPCRTRAAGKDKILAISNPEAFSIAETTAQTALRNLVSWAVYGGSSYVYGQLARGRLDFALDCGLDPYDYLALAVVIGGAGGVVTDWEGRKLTINSGHRILAAGDACAHKTALSVINNAMR
jgi:histidinol phosphatase-like enzyme (inositol monophosphatase family)